MAVAWVLLLLSAAHMVTPVQLRNFCRTSEYGAAPSDIQYATAALQAAIDACSDSCGTVLVDRPGAYLSATLRLTGCVHLELPAGVTLLAGSERQDYGATQSEWYLVLFRNCISCSLSGGGTIDGRARLWVLPPGRLQAEQQLLLAGPHAEGQLGGRSLQHIPQLAQPLNLGDQQQQQQQDWQQRQQQQQQQQDQQQQQQGGELPRKAVRNWQDPSCPKPEECRPRLVGVLDSSHVSINDVTLTDPVYWCLHVLRSQHVHISGVRIRGDWDIPNNDGIDVDSSRHVSIRHADVDTADDAICLKTTVPDRPLEHVSVTDCRLRSRSSAVKLGSESVADMRHISFADLAIVDSHRGLAVQLRDGGSISHVQFRNISVSTRYYHPSWWGAAEPIYVTAVPRNPAMQVGVVSNVSFQDIRAVAENGIFLAGGPLPCSSSSTGSSGSSRSGTGLHQQWEQHPYRYSLQGISLSGVRLRLVRRSSWPGGCQDYRPSSSSSGGGGSRGGSSGGSSARWCWPAGLDCSSSSTAAVWVAGAEQALLSGVQAEYCPPARVDWRQQLHVDASSTRSVAMEGVRIVNGSCFSNF